VRSDDPILHAKNAIRGAVSNKKLLGPAISEQLTELDESQYPVFRKWLNDYSLRSRNSAAKRRVDTYKELSPDVVSAPSDDSKALYWLVQAINQNADLISEFRCDADDFEIAWYDGRLEDAEKMLFSIRQKYGLSYWWIQTNIAFLHINKGVEAQKEFVKAVHNEAPNTVVSFIAHYASMRNEDQVSVSRFITRIDRVVAEQKVSEELKSYLRFILVNDVSADRGFVPPIAAVATATSPIDAYEVFLCLLEQTICFSAYEIYPAIVSRSVNECLVQDWALENIKTIVCNSPDKRLPAETQASDDLICGRYEAAIDNAKREMQNDPRRFDCYWIIAMATAFQGRDQAELSLPSLPSLPTQITRSLTIVCERHSSIISASSDLLKLFLNLRSQKLTKGLAGLFSREWVTRDIIGPSSSTTLFIYSPVATPLQAMVVERLLGQSLLSKFDFSQSAYAMLIARQLALWPTLPQNIVKEIGLESEAIYALATNQIYLAKQLIDQLEQAAQAVWSRRAAKLAILANLIEDDLESAIKKIAVYCCQNEEFRYFLPLRQVFKGLEWRDLVPLQQEIHLPIALEAYVRSGAKAEFETLLRFAYDEFVKSKGVTRPSELRVLDYPTPLLAYFLARVCVPHVMDISYKTFKSSREVEEERKAICSLLSQLDPSNASQYSTEIVNITKALAIQDGLRDIDLSRVHVNTDAIHRWGEIELVESFERYKALQSLSDEDQEESDRLFNAILAGRVEKDSDELQNYLKYPEDEAGAQLIEIVNQIQHEFFMNSDYGLDAFLSMRVRHGSLAGNLRGPLEDVRLVTQKQPHAQAYEENQFWNEFFSDMSSSERKDLQRALADFSKAYDAIIEGLVKQRLQILASEKPLGLFVPTLEPLWFHYIRNLAGREPTLSDLLSATFIGLESRLDHNLLVVYEYFLNQVKEQIESAIDNLRKDLRPLLSERYTYINDAISAATPELHVALTRVSEWFKPAKKSTSRVTRTIDEILDVAIEATKSAHRGFDPLVTREICDLGRLDSRTLSFLTDLIFIVLGNVAQHSGLGANPEVKVQISIESISHDSLGRKERMVLFRFVSEIAPEVCTEEKRRALERVRHLLKSGAYKQRVNLEGGTGLPKLQRMVSIDERQSLTFDFISNEAFSVEVRINLLYGADASMGETA
jgi:hypothetical protein